MENRILPEFRALSPQIRLPCVLGIVPWMYPRRYAALCCAASRLYATMPLCVVNVLRAVSYDM